MTDDRQTENAAPGGTCAAVGSADDFRKILHCLGLLNSMVRGGERHSDTSARMTVEALEALERIEQPNSAISLKSPPRNSAETRKPGKAALSAAWTCQSKGLRKNAANHAAGGKDGV